MGGHLKLKYSKRNLMESRLRISRIFFGGRPSHSPQWKTLAFLLALGFVSSLIEAAFSTSSLVHPKHCDFSFGSSLSAR